MTFFARRAVKECYLQADCGDLHSPTFCLPCRRSRGSNPFSRFGEGLHIAVFFLPGVRKYVCVDGNRLTDNSDGIVAVEAHDNLISRNTITGTGLLTDPSESGGFGIILDGADRNTLDRNIVTGGRGPAIFVTSLDRPTASEDNIVTRNVANSKLDGILVNNGATGTLIKRNTANRSGDDGIDVDVDVPATTLTRNTANRNHDLGIEAVPGTIDGGGNKARGNGNPLQCTNVFCN